MKKTRRKFSSGFKAKVVLEAIRERETLVSLASRYELHPTQIAKWKREFIESADKIFDSESAKESEQDNVNLLYQKIGQLEVERDFLKKSLWKTGL